MAPDVEGSERPSRIRRGLRLDTENYSRLRGNQFQLRVAQYQSFEPHAVV